MVKKNTSYLPAEEACRIYDGMRQSGLSIQDVADSLELSRPYVSMMIRGKCSAPQEHVAGIYALIEQRRESVMGPYLERIDALGELYADASAAKKKRILKGLEKLVESLLP